jgi:hypothetical protein
MAPIATLATAREQLPARGAQIARSTRRIAAVFGLASPLPQLFHAWRP